MNTAPLIGGHDIFQLGLKTSLKNVETCILELGISFSGAEALK